MEDLISRGGSRKADIPGKSVDSSDRQQRVESDKRGLGLSKII